jgi:PAS domain S-box-containing protein
MGFWREAVGHMMCVQQKVRQPISARRADSAAMIHIVDDSPEDRTIIRSFLSRAAGAERQSLQFHEFECGEDGLAGCMSSTPDCLLLDNYLPDMNSIHFLDRIRGEDGAVPLPVVVLTGATERSLAASTLLAGAMEYLPKRYLGPEMLLRAVESARDRFNLAQGRRAAEAALRLSEERYRTLVTTTSQLVWTADVAGNGRGDMLSWREFTGQSAEQMQGSGWAAVVHPDDRQATLDAWADAVQHGSSFEIEHRLRARTGEYRYFLARGAAVRNIDGSIREWIGASTDITERKQAEAQVRRLNAELEQRVAERTARLETANQDLESFSYSVSHDLRSPLRAINGFARILLDEYGADLNADGRRLLDMVADGAKTMTRMIDNVLVFSRVSRDDLIAMDIDMADLVGNSLKELAPAMAERNPVLKVGPLPRAWGTVPMIQRVWTNLLDNALKYTAQAEQAQITIGTTAGQTVDEVVYFVRDNGVGFDMQYADKLFGVFERLHGPDFPGTGIGLAIVKRIVERHGGRVWADSKVDEGSTFYFALPCGQTAAQGALASHQDQRR